MATPTPFSRWFPTRFALRSRLTYALGVRFLKQSRTGIGRQASVLRACVHPHWLRAAGALKAKLLVKLDG